MNEDELRDERIRIMILFHPEGPITMSASSKEKSITGEIDESISLIGAGNGKKIYEDHQGADERRLGIERRRFSYTVYIPERRSGRERRGIVENSLSSHQQ
jgi:hypothetical protein